VEYFNYFYQFWEVCSSSSAYGIWRHSCFALVIIEHVKTFESISGCNKVMKPLVYVFQTLSYDISLMMPTMHVTLILMHIWDALDLSSVTKMIRTPSLASSTACKGSSTTRLWRRLAAFAPPSPSLPTADKPHCSSFKTQKSHINPTPKP
jgi:hypothetical protein